MKNIKFGSFFLGLALVIGALSTQGIAGQEPAQSRPKVRVLDGRGAQLGVTVSDVDPTEPQGVRIDDVNPDSPAEKAGLRERDIVVEYDGERVRSARQLTRLVQETPEGRSVPIAVMRNGQKQTMEATPETRTAFNFGFDPDDLRDDIERGLRGFRVVPPVYRYDDRGPRAFEYRLPERVMPFMGMRGRLGVTVQPLTPDLEEYFGVNNGLLVSSVSRDSAAEKAGLKAGDVITAINGRQVEDHGDLMRELRDVEGEVKVEIVRDKQPLTLTVVVAAV